MAGKLINRSALEIEQETEVCYGSASLRSNPSPRTVFFNLFSPPLTSLFSLYNTPCRAADCL